MMTNSSLYNSCLRKISIDLKDGIYKSYQDNPFSVLPLEIVDDLMSAALSIQRMDRFNADDLEQLLTCGRLRKIKFSRINSHSMRTQIFKALKFLKYGCQKLEILNLAGSLLDCSIIRSMNQENLALLTRLSKVLGDVLKNSLNLKDLHSCIAFDLKALRKCKKLRRLRLHFLPYENWSNFLAIGRGYVQIHECLEFFTICYPFDLRVIPYKYLVIILRHCPALRTLGFIESSESLSELRKMGVSASELKLRQCYWKADRLRDTLGNLIPSLDYKIHQIKEAALYYPMMEELDFDCCSSKCIPSLRNFRNLNFLNITCGLNVRDVDIRDGLIEIGPQLKHLSFQNELPTDVSIILHICPNLESLRIQGYRFKEFEYPVVNLPKLKRLTIKCIRYFGRRVFSLISNCNQLIELFLRQAYYLDDKTLNDFLNKNCLSNLKVAYFESCRVTDLGFRQLLLNSPQLERVSITDLDNRYYEGQIFETNNKVLRIDRLLSEEAEFFWKRFRFYNCKEY